MLEILSNLDHGCSARGIRPTIRSGSRSNCSSRSSTTARERTSRRLTKPQRLGSAPRKMLSATLSVGTRENSWNTPLIPYSRAARTDPTNISRPSKRIFPAVGSCAPESSVMSVDLPAPFSPKALAPRRAPAQSRRRQGLSPRVSTESDRSPEHGLGSGRDNMRTWPPESRRPQTSEDAGVDDAGASPLAAVQ